MPIHYIYASADKCVRMGPFVATRGLIYTYLLHLRIGQILDTHRLRNRYALADWWVCMGRWICTHRPMNCYAWADKPPRIGPWFVTHWPMYGYPSDLCIGQSILTHGLMVFYVYTLANALLPNALTHRPMIFQA